MYLHIRLDDTVNPDRSNSMYERVADLFGLLASPMRLRVVCSLIDGERNVSDLAERLAASQPSMSQHLGTLYRGGVLARRRTGAQTFYRIDNEQVRSLCQVLEHRQAESMTGTAVPDTAR